METMVDFKGSEFLVQCPYWDNHRAKMIPDRVWDAKLKNWRAPAIKPNATYLENTYRLTEFTDEAIDKINDLLAETNEPKKSFPAWYKFKNDPLPHQMQCLNKLYGTENMAFFMWMGRGKSFTCINMVSALAMEDKVNALLIVCPSGVKPVWPDEWEKHSVLEADFFIMEAGQVGARAFIQRKSDFKVMVVGIEALSQGKGFDVVEKFCLSHRVFMAIDESSDIKNHKSIRTKRCWHLGGLSHYRLIMTGTEVTEGIENLFAQYRFLNWQIVGHKSFFTFAARYCVYGGYDNRQIVGYNNIKELMEAVYPYTYSIGKDVAGLPPKIYEPPYKVHATPEQQKAFNELKEQEFTEIDDKELIVETVLERTMRYQQIAGGFFPYDEEEGGHGIIPIPGKNPKLEALMEIISRAPAKQQIIIWAKFVPEVNLIYETIQKKYGGAVRYKGGSTTDERKHMIKAFQDGLIRFIVANKSMAKGVTVTAATLVIYYSNDFSYDMRIQSEERCHRIGQENSVTYMDIIINHPVEASVLKALHEKKSLAEYVKTEMGAYK